MINKQTAIALVVGTVFILSYAVPFSQIFAGPQNQTHIQQFSGVQQQPQQQNQKEQSENQITAQIFGANQQNGHGGGNGHGHGKYGDAFSQ
jgi:hypothetical protein